MMRALSNLLGKGSVTLADDTGDVLLLQVTEGAQGTGGADRVVDKVPRLAEFGFASVPPLGALAMMVRRTADRARGVVIATSHAASRPKGMKPGDTCLYDIRGVKMMLTGEGPVIDCAGLPMIIQNASTITLRATEKVTIDAPSAEFTGTIHATGRISTDTDVSVAGHLFTTLRQAYGVHKHTGVKSGTDVSAGPDTAA